MNSKLKKSEQLKAEAIERVVALVKERLSGEAAKQGEQFVRQYYRKVPPGDLLRDDAETLYGAALAFWKFSSKRTSGEDLIRVYNPNLEEHGWQSDHTVVEVVTTDKPFIVDSVASQLNKLDKIIYLTVHPVIETCRDDDGSLIDTLAIGEKQPKSWKGKACSRESYMQVLINRQSGDDQLDAIRQEVRDCLREVSAAVRDWQDMRAKALEAVEDYKNAPKSVDEDISAEVRNFMQWLHDDHFTFLGYGELEFKRNKVDSCARELGILTNPSSHIVDEVRELAEAKTKSTGFASSPNPLVVSKSTHKSEVHRPVHMDIISVKKFDSKGKCTSIRLFIGLFTSAAYNRTPREIPLLAGKFTEIMARANFARGSHDSKALANILDTFPRDELFHISDEELFDMCMGILHLQDRQRVALFMRQDNFGRSVSCLVYVPRDSFTTELRHRMQGLLEEYFGGEVMAFYTQIGDSPLARLHVMIRTPAGLVINDTDILELEQRLVTAARSWADLLHDALVAARGEENGLALYRRYQKAFPLSYKETHNAATALADLAKIEETLESGTVQMTLYRPIEAADHEVRFKIFHPSTSVPLSHVLPMLENMGLKVLDEQPFTVAPEGGEKVMLHDFGLETSSQEPVDLASVRQVFSDAFRQVWNGRVENDGFNRLVIQAGLDWRNIVLLRAYCKYLRQVNIPFSQSYMQRALASNAGITKAITRLFHAQFNPNMTEYAAKVVREIKGELAEALEQVANADEDRILRRFLNLVECTLRTNYYQPGPDGDLKEYLSFKFDSGKQEDLPLPRPWREIFVYSPRVEGVHLRGGPVARGGLRWSDRREDFRTEILGLVKAQMVKNAVIVPVGSKGGFVVKRPPAGGDRKAFLDEGIECYKMFIRGLLDVTDNLVKGELTPPESVVRRDDDDPYLVVAADKGTATFSDIANGVSEDYGFWMGDAFASGGSAGYDHKKMGITAKGAWESVKRHFREMGKNIQAEDFTVIGVGDMGGDVFGNGMLLSEHIQLVAAFNHLHIFIDPTPDAASSFKERQRLFDAVKGWNDYDTKLISKGGGVFERSAKKIDITPEIKQALGITRDVKSMTPAELINTILKSPVELLWFGGIGTYIKETGESHADTGDRGNDGIRVNAPDLRCKVIGEGANLGMTQRSRIEYALGGGRCNTDSIDNSAGVDCSDHEVNIKILLNAVVAAGDMTVKQRNVLLEEMTDEVSDLVLRDNYLQSQAITLVRSTGTSVLDYQSRLMKFLEKEGRLNRDVEYLPNEEVMQERAATKVGLTRPEISVLMPYGKIWIYDELLASKLPDEPRLTADLIRYFPTQLQKRFESEILSHMLRREIIATHITNSMVNRVGGTFVTQLMEKTGAGPEEIARAYLVTRDAFNLRSLWAEIEALDNQVSADDQLNMLAQINRLVERGTLWFLRNVEKPLDIGAQVETFEAGITDLVDHIDAILDNTEKGERVGQATLNLKAAGVPESLASKVSAMNVLAAGCDIVNIARDRKLAPVDVGKVYFAAGARFGFGWMRQTGEDLGLDNHWQKLAIASMIEDLYACQTALTARVLDHGNSVEAIEAWVADNGLAVEQTTQVISEIRATPKVDFAMLTVANRALRDMIFGTGG